MGLVVGLTSNRQPRWQAAKKVPQLLATCITAPKPGRAHGSWRPTTVGSAVCPVRRPDSSRACRADRPERRTILRTHRCRPASGDETVTKRRVCHSVVLSYDFWGVGRATAFGIASTNEHSTPIAPGRVHAPREYSYRMVALPGERA